jgi:hypothetical protein
VVFFFFTSKILPKRENQNYKLRKRRSDFQRFLVTRTEERKKKKNLKKIDRFVNLFSFHCAAKDIGGQIRQISKKNKSKSSDFYDKL